MKNDTYKNYKFPRQLQISEIQKQLVEKISKSKENYTSPLVSTYLEIWGHRIYTWSPNSAKYSRLPLNISKSR